MAVPLDWQGLPDHCRDVVQGIIERGQGSWLRDEQVAYLLILGVSGVLPVNQEPHAQAPQVGSIFLFHKGVSFREDFYEWSNREGTNKDPIVVGQVERLRLYYAAPKEGRQGAMRRYTYWLLGAGKEHIRLVHYGLREWPNREQVQGQQDQVPPVPQVPHEAPVLLLRAENWPGGTWELVERDPQQPAPQKRQREPPRLHPPRPSKQRLSAQPPQQQHQQEEEEKEKEQGAGIIPPSPSASLQAQQPLAALEPPARPLEPEGRVPSASAAAQPGLRRPQEAAPQQVLEPAFYDKLEELEDFDSFVEAQWNGQPIPMSVQALTDEGLEVEMVDAHNVLQAGLLEDFLLPAVLQQVAAAAPAMQQEQQQQPAPAGPAPEPQQQQQQPEVPLAILSLAPGHDSTAGGASLHITVEQHGPISAAALGHLHASFGGEEVSAVLVSSDTVICTVPPTGQPGFVALFLTLGAGQPVSNQVPFEYTGPGAAPEQKVEQPVEQPSTHASPSPPLPQQQQPQPPPPPPPPQQQQQQGGGQQPGQPPGGQERVGAAESMEMGAEAGGPGVEPEEEAMAALEAGRKAMQEQRFGDAYEAFSTAVELGRNSGSRTKGALGRSAAAMRLGRPQQAAAEARLAQELRPGDARGAVAEGLAHVAGREYRRALHCLKRARELEPGYPGIDRLACAAVEAGRRMQGGSLQVLHGPEVECVPTGQQQGPPLRVARATGKPSVQASIGSPTPALHGAMPTRAGSLKHGLSFLRGAAGGLCGGGRGGGSPKPSPMPGAETGAKAFKATTSVGGLRRLLRRLSSAFGSGHSSAGASTGGSPRSGSGAPKGDAAAAALAAPAVETPPTPRASPRGLRRTLS